MWTNGDVHIGQYKNDVKHGPGVYYFSDTTER